MYFISYFSFTQKIKRNTILIDQGIEVHERTRFIESGLKLV